MGLRPSLLGKAFAAGIALILAGMGTTASAQSPSNLPQTPAQILPPDRLDNLVAPIALYPDPLLGQVLVACTYPLEITEAQQWLQANRSLSGSSLIDAARQQNWDASVQALVAFPDVLAKLTQDIRWTADLGNAFLSQQADVMSAVQRMRASAQANGRLSSTPQQVVTTDTQDGQSAIDIQPANPQVIYVPAYDPMYVWGPPAWGAYPPLFYPTFGFGFGPGFDIGLCFGGWGGWGGWGWGPNWFGHDVFVNGGFFRHYGFRQGPWGGGFQGRGIWAHDPTHRLGVPYPNRQLSGRFQSASAASRGNIGRFGGTGTFGRSYAAPRSSFQGQQRSLNGRYGGNGQYGGRTAAPAYQGYRGSASQGMARSYQAPQRYQSRPSFQAAPRSSAPNFSRGLSGGGMRSYGGGGARSFGGGGGGHSFGGGGARSVGGGGGSHSFGGGGGHSFGGGGGHGGGGHGGGRK